MPDPGMEPRVEYGGSEGQKGYHVALAADLVIEMYIVAGCHRIMGPNKQFYLLSIE